MHCTAAYGGIRTSTLFAGIPLGKHGEEMLHGGPLVLGVQGYGMARRLVDPDEQRGELSRRQRPETTRHLAAFDRDPVDHGGLLTDSAGSACWAASHP